MNVLMDCIIFLILADWVLFNFYLKQKQRCSVWNLENVSLISFHGVIWSRYSEISLEKAKTYFSKNNNNNSKKSGFKGNFKYEKAVCFTGYS